MAADWSPVIYPLSHASDPKIRLWSEVSLHKIFVGIIIPNRRDNNLQKNNESTIIIIIIQNIPKISANFSRPGRVTDLPAAHLTLRGHAPFGGCPGQPAAAIAENHLWLGDKLGGCGNPTVGVACKWTHLYRNGSWFCAFLGRCCSGLHMSIVTNVEVGLWDVSVC